MTHLDQPLGVHPAIGSYTVSTRLHHQQHDAQHTTSQPRHLLVVDTAGDHRSPTNLGQYTNTLHSTGMHHQTR